MALTVDSIEATHRRQVPWRRVWSRRACTVWLGGSLWWAAGCASSPAGPSQAEVDAAFARIQEHEARIDAGRAALRHAGDDCHARCSQLRRIQQEAAAICQLAGELDDADARLRCEAARRGAAPASPTSGGCACAAGAI